VASFASSVQLGDNAREALHGAIRRDLVAFAGAERAVSAKTLDLDRGHADSLPPVVMPRPWFLDLLPTKEIAS
jgi:hypothetical protein